jgi:hypothetical protein
MKSKNPETKKRHTKEEEVLKFVKKIGIPQEQFKKTNHSLYHPPLFKNSEELDELKLKNPKTSMILQEMESLKLQAERYEV